MKICSKFSLGGTPGGQNMQLAANMAQEASKSIFKTVWEALWRPSWAKLGASWGQVGARLEPSWAI